MIKVKGLSFGYKKEPLLKDISLTLDRGELCSVIGLNGSGKTTLLRLLARMLTQQNGTVEIDGKYAHSYTQKEYAQKISWLPQVRDIPSVNAADYIASGRYPYIGFSAKLSKEDIKCLDRAVSLTDTHTLLTKKLSELSGGERQRVYFALLMAQDTPYVLLDEPTTYLDPSSAIDISQLILKLKAEGKGILSVSHDLSSALKYSDKILVIHDRSAAFCGSPQDVIDSHIIEQVFGVRCIECCDDGEKEYIFKRI